MDNPQELLNSARRIIDQLTANKSKHRTARLLSQRLQRLAFHAAPSSRDD
jgi:hypothetical protein